MTAKEKICKLKKIDDKTIFVKRINDYSMRFIQGDNVYDYFFSCPVYGLDGNLIYLGFREQTDDNIYYCGYNVRIYLKKGDLLFEQDSGIFKVRFIDQVFTGISAGNLIYDKCVVVPTFNGVMVKCLGEVCLIKIETDNEKNIVDKVGTLLLSGSTIDTFAMVVGLSSFYDQKVVECIPSIKRYSEKEFYIDVSATNAIGFSFEISAYCSKSICDTVIKQAHPDYSGPFSGIFCSYANNEKRLLFRPGNTLARILTSEQNKVIHAYLPRLRGVELGIKKILNSWCSFRTTWQNCPLYEDREIRYSVECDYFVIDLTKEYAKNSVPGYGFMLYGKNENKEIAISTGDSLYFPYIIEIKKEV